MGHEDTMVDKLHELAEGGETHRTGEENEQENEQLRRAKNIRRAERVIESCNGDEEILAKFLAVITLQRELLRESLQEANE